MKKTTMSVLVLVLSLLYSLISPTIAVTSDNKITLADLDSDVTIVAHRGASGYAPENTVAAFDKALEMNADYIEFDVQRSKDGVLIIIHDLTVDRTTNGEGVVKELTFKQLKSLDAGSWKGSQFRGQKIPTFEEIIDSYHEKIGILIELKSPELYPGIEKQLVQILKKHNLDQPLNAEIIIQSFNHDSMKKIKKLLPNVPIGVLISKKEHTTEQALEEFSSYADFFNPKYQILTEELVNRATAKGMKVFPWTVRSLESAELVLDMKSTAIITDYPDYGNQVKPGSYLSFVK